METATHVAVKRALKVGPRSQPELKRILGRGRFCLFLFFGSANQFGDSLDQFPFFVREGIFDSIFLLFSSFPCVTIVDSVFFPS